jgi:hypothetical protein
LMYNTFLHRYLVIELIDTEFMPEYIGKLNFYCSAVDDILCREGDNRTIGLLLCKSKDRIKAEYALRDIQKPIGISDYELGQALPKDFRGSLPTIEEIEKELYHTLHVAHRKTLYFGIIVLQVHGQALQGFLAPTICILTLLQHTSNIPIHSEHFFVGGINRSLLGNQYPLLDFTKQCRITIEIICQVINCLFICIFSHNLL